MAPPTAGLSWPSTFDKKESAFGFSRFWPCIDIEFEVYLQRALGPAGHTRLRFLVAGPGIFLSANTCRALSEAKMCGRAKQA